MSRNVTKIFSEKQDVPIWTQQLRVAAYCRVSTKHEEQQRSLETPIDYYTAYIKNNPNWGLAGIYFDTASGIRTNQRPGYKQLMRDCTKKKVNLRNR